MRLICGLIFIGVFHYGACRTNPDGDTNSIVATTSFSMSAQSLATSTANTLLSTAYTVSTSKEVGNNASIKPTVDITTSPSVVTNTTGAKAVSETTVVTKKDNTTATQPPSASTPSRTITMTGPVQVLNTTQTETNNMSSTIGQPESTSLNSATEVTGTTNTPFTSKATSTAHVPTPIGTSTIAVTTSGETSFCKRLQGKFKFTSCNIAKEAVNDTTMWTVTFQISQDEMETVLKMISLVNPTFQYTTPTTPTMPTTPPETTSSTSLVIILASVGALLATLAVIVIYIICHRRSYKMNQQHLTEELHTTENGYHDNPTLEVMEVQPEMQEKKAALRDFNDSWIVPIDNLAKDDLPEEEDTHL